MDYTSLAGGSYLHTDGLQKASLVMPLLAIVVLGLGGPVEQPAFSQHVSSSVTNLYNRDQYFVKNITKTLIATKI